MDILRAADDVYDDIHPGGRAVPCRLCDGGLAPVHGRVWGDLGRDAGPRAVSQDCRPAGRGSSECNGLYAAVADGQCTDIHQFIRPWVSVGAYDKRGAMLNTAADSWRKNLELFFNVGPSG